MDDVWFIAPWNKTRWSSVLPWGMGGWSAYYCLFWGLQAQREHRRQCGHSIRQPGKIAKAWRASLTQILDNKSIEKDWTLLWNVSCVHLIILLQYNCSYVKQKYQMVCQGTQIFFSGASRLGVDDTRNLWSPRNCCCSALVPISPVC